MIETIFRVRILYLKRSNNKVDYLALDIGIKKEEDDCVLEYSSVISSLLLIIYFIYLHKRKE